MTWAARTEAEYDRRLLQRVQQWEAKNATEAAGLRLTTQRQIGMHEPPPDGSLRWLSLETAFREAVRKVKGWPTKDAWMRGKDEAV